MEYQEVKEKLETLKVQLINKKKNENLTIEERENIEKLIVNYDYIIELTDMNHFERGSMVN